MWTQYFARAGATLLLLLQVQIAGAQSFSDKAKRDEGIVATKGDPHMEAAFRKAKESLGAFLKLARQEPPFIISYAVKIPLREGNITEYFWISPFVERNGNFIGILNNTPRSVSKYKAGQKITFHESDVVDWMYREEGKMVGNFTVCALLKSAPPDQAAEFRKQQGLDCED
jgi:uncharacterized protein YegJ (DUF2314 family)